MTYIRSILKDNKNISLPMMKKICQIVIFSLLPPTPTKSKYKYPFKKVTSVAKYIKKRI